MHCPPVLPLLVSGLAVLAALLAGRPESAQAEVIVHQGLQFSDEEGGFTLLSVSGTGTLDDPIVVVEEVAATRNITLVIRGFSRGFGNRVGTQHVSAFAMKKIVINRSDRLWRNFQMELREVSTRRSPYSDGLSFGQNSTIGEGYTASSFPHTQRFDEPEDSLG
ncbi:MAG: hypothetical protein JNL25_03460, partial [Rhodospirillaceae bacterium]|nr:hypothetical protein [Rhodospirillaceae bacterium]